MSAAQPRPVSPPSKSWTLSADEETLRQQFAALRDPRDVAALLDVPYWQLSFAIHRSVAVTRYKSIDIPKRSGGVRRLKIPNPTLAALQKKLLQVLEAVYMPKSCVHGFVKGRSVVTNAKPHVRSEWVLNIDLKDFFPSINFGRVRGMFMASPYELPSKVATTLAQICCFENQLPQGSPTSPIVSNMICARLDGDLLALAQRHRLVYSRFADDLSFSTNTKKFPRSVARRDSESRLTVLGTDLDTTIRRNGFEVNTSKCRLQGRAGTQQVTGLTVSKFPNVRRSFVRQVRAMMHAWEKFGIRQAAAEHFGKIRKIEKEPDLAPSAFRKTVRGRLAYISMVRGEDDSLATRLWERYANLDPQHRRRHKRTVQERVADAMWVLECVYLGPTSDEKEQGTAFAVEGIGLLTCEHVLADGTYAFKTSAHDKHYEVEVVAKSEELDLAVLKVSAPLDHSLKLNLSYSPSIGQSVDVSGFPNYQWGDTGYFLSQKIAGIRSASGHPRALTSGPIAGGMSGGPVVDSNGDVIGVIVSGARELKQANLTERHGFIPIEVVVRFLRSNGLLAD